jgi:hypothetical protein
MVDPSVLVQNFVEAAEKEGSDLLLKCVLLSDAKTAGWTEDDFE